MSSAAFRKHSKRMRHLVGNNHVWGSYNQNVGSNALITYPLFTMPVQSPSNNVPPIVKPQFMCCFHLHVDVIYEQGCPQYPNNGVMILGIGVHRSAYDTRLGIWSTLNPCLQTVPINNQNGVNVGDVESPLWYDVRSLGFWLGLGGTQDVFFSFPFKYYEYDEFIHVDEEFCVGQGLQLELIINEDAGVDHTWDVVVSFQCAFRN